MKNCDLNVSDNYMEEMYPVWYRQALAREEIARKKCAELNYEKKLGKNVPDSVINSARSNLKECNFLVKYWGDKC